MQITSLTFQFVKEFPATESFGLARQLTRAAISIPSNIAEGSSRSTSKHTQVYLETALGSAFEVETQVLIALELNFGSKVKAEFLLKLVCEEQMMINGYISKLKAR